VVTLASADVAGGDRLRVQSAIDELTAALERDEWAGWDPYDALSSPGVRAVARTALLRQVAIQTLKRLPVNPRPLLRVPKQQHTKALALLVSGYARLATRGDADSRKRALMLADALVSRAIQMPKGIGWGYDFDVQTRWGYYRRGEPNAIATAFAVHALLDLSELDGVERFDDLVDGALQFAQALLHEEHGVRFFAYYPRSPRCVHNANLLLSSLYARRASSETAEFRAARDAMRYSLSCQGDDGSWQYGEGPGLDWIDGFHTAYVLDALALWHRATDDVAIEAAILRGLRFVRTRLVDDDGAPRATPARRYPIDIHAASSLIRTFTELRHYDVETEETATRLLKWTLETMRRRDGRFAFQVHRRYRNAVPYIRWSDGHMLLALASYATSDGDD
jgi:hypothetical protein